ncbi:hypothetical protein Exig_2781 [Exiguobacterium sibiricum 255-15]|uniref:Uncharacterized protein n=1 Tax=Exiguobacterium sibiricum (strain DSM 17290 / CCUG 55495 / CIP 109462 / JCM 13490 / 255-15) TaxID=262543 RepID=B1YF03_EXIS2|nr:hypothetical protein [Exiguobacterium sibiricum]ACB62227.1 hypothetical protein Exig_2781 [Exiguobacterium sibiricum 255-15]
MQTAKDERLHELTLAYIDKSQLQKNGWLMAAVAATLGILSETMDSALYLGLLPLVYLIFELPFQLEKRRILERYLSKDQIMTQSMLWLGIQIVLYGSLLMVILETSDLSLWKMTFWVILILASIYFATDWLFKKMARSGDPDFVSDQEVHKHVKYLEE